MSSELFDHYSNAVRTAFARGLNCDVDAFEGEQLTIVELPAGVTWATLMGVTFGTGTVVSVDPAYREFVEGNRPSKHYRALSAAWLSALAAEGARRGQKLNFFPASLCFTIAQEPPEIAVPEGFELRRHDAEWMNAEQASGRFHNGVGVSGEDGRDFRNRYALTLQDADGKPAAVAGAFDTHGMMEIGVDVMRAHRGAGFGRLVVAAMAREIIREGAIPFYGCAPTNIRSHRTAESCGFRIVCADGFVGPAA